MGDVLLFTLQTFAPLYLVIVILRFLLQLIRADYYNPISQFVVKATQPLLFPLRRVIPGVANIDIACLVLALLVAFIIISLGLVVVGLAAELANFLPQIAIWSLLAVVSMFIKVFYFTLIASVILSWVGSPSNPFVMLIHQLVEPVLAPIRRFLPDLGGLDISPIIAFFALNLIDRFVLFPIWNFTLGEGVPAGVISVLSVFT